MEHSGCLEALKALHTSDLVFAPWLYYEGESQRVTTAQDETLRQVAFRLTRQHWQTTKAPADWPEYQVTPEVVNRAMYEMLTSTAAYLTHLRLGTLVVTDEMVAVSERLTDVFVMEHRFSALLTSYLMLSTYENLQAILHYKEMQREVFLAGTLHRPWLGADASVLQDELTALEQMGLVDQPTAGISPVVRVTNDGLETYRVLEKLLHESQMLNLRAALMRAARFTSLEDYDPLMERLFKNGHASRRRLIEWTGIEPGMNVLELGCGTGLLTFEDGLLDAVGETGSITAIDPAPGMLARAELKRQRLAAKNVRFVQARAESLPFSDNEFDAVIGSGFLHFTDASAVLHEAARVGKSGGIFGTAFPLGFHSQKAFFPEWFEPVMTRGQGQAKADMLPVQHHVSELATRILTNVQSELSSEIVDYSDPEVAVRFFVRVANLFERPMSELPWQARRDMEQTLIDRGYSVRAAYGSDELVYEHQTEWIRGIIP